MAGTLFGLPLSIQFDEAGRPAAGGLLYIYDANTSTPANSYSDFALSTVRTNPIELDAAGRIPSFYVDDGSYRARLTTSGGVELFDEQSITAIGASTGGDSDSGTSSAENVFQVGDFLWQPVTGTKSGWVRCNARTIGSGSSAGTERANADVQALYEYFWNNFSDTLCPVTSGRGGSATADFSANKVIATPDMRGRAAFGLDDMGNSAASRLVVGTPTAVSSGGAEKQTIATANLPSHTHSAGTLETASDGAHTHTSSFANQGSQNAGTGNQRNEADSNSSESTSSNGAHTHTITGATAATGSGTALTTTPPYMLGTWYAKL